MGVVAVIGLGSVGLPLVLAIGRLERTTGFNIAQNKVQAFRQGTDRSPVLERVSGLVWKQDFSVGYSAERINPGDKEHQLTSITKVVSGDTPETLASVASLYERIIVPGVYRAPSMRTAEASKVIENTPRNLNIALMNELAIIFDRMGLDTSEVLTAASTKWNFLRFKPGLVGGHCIGVDPYCLTHKAEMMGYHPQVILAGRRIKDGMGKIRSEQTIKKHARSRLQRQGRHGQRAGADVQGKLRGPALFPVDWHPPGTSQL
jgi:nucleotide sugar dehydrogenase